MRISGVWMKVCSDLLIGGEGRSGGIYLIIGGLISYGRCNSVNIYLRDVIHLSGDSGKNGRKFLFGGGFLSGNGGKS